MHPLPGAARSWSPVRATPGCTSPALRLTVKLRSRPEIDLTLVDQAGVKRQHMAVRDFVRNAADVLLALKPCWAMSPLVVSELLPPMPHSVMQA